MGSIITLGVGRLEIDWGKNSFFHNHSRLFFRDDVKPEIYYYADNVQEAQPAFSRPLRKVLLRLELLGYSLANCRRLYDEVAAPADYGSGLAILDAAGLPPGSATLHPESGGWLFLTIPDYQLPEGFQPNRVELLVKLPPGFPDAAPDMFWVSPEVRTSTGSLPRATSNESLLGKTWQRFSWHLAAGAWKPGVSDLREFLRCIRSRFLRQD